MELLDHRIVFKFLKNLYTIFYGGSTTLHSHSEYNVQHKEYSQHFK